MGATARACPTSPTSSTTTASPRTTGSCGAATTPSTTGAARCSTELESRPATWAKLSRHFFETFPQLDGVRFSHIWGGAIDTCSRFCVFWGTAMSGRVAYALGYTGLGVASTRFGAEVMLDLLDGRRTRGDDRPTSCSDKPLPFPPEPFRFAGIQATRWSLDREDRTGKRNLWLRTLDRLGLGFDLA